MRQIATTREQSARLLACGIYADTADMIGIEPNYGYECEPWSSMQGQDTSGYFPAWSLNALLGLLPKELNDFPFTKWYEPFDEEWEVRDKATESTINGEVKLYFINGCWIVNYEYDGFTGRLPQSDNPIEACVLAIDLLTANGYKLNGIEKGGEK